MSRISAAPTQSIHVSTIGISEHSSADRRFIRIEASKSPVAMDRVRGLQNYACRLVNVVVALVGIVLTFPLMFVLGALIKLTSPGPILYTQPRVGIDRRGGSDRRDGGRGTDTGRRKSDNGGRVFRIYKFRTMRVHEGAHRQVWATQNDPRITKIGSILRKYRLDELPQLFNVLIGDMNVVGPRPEQPEIVRELREAVDGYLGRQQVLPGITGWAQVNHSYDACIDDVRKKVDLDLEYIGQRSVAKDLMIMARTLPVMIGKRGAI